jgi:hypothetical protein
LSARPACALCALSNTHGGEASARCAPRAPPGASAAASWRGPPERRNTWSWPARNRRKRPCQGGAAVSACSARIPCGPPEATRSRHAGLCAGTHMLCSTQTRRPSGRTVPPHETAAQTSAASTFTRLGERPRARSAPDAHPSAPLSDAARRDHAALSKAALAKLRAARRKPKKRSCPKGGFLDEPFPRGLQVAIPKRGRGWLQERQQSATRPGFFTSSAGSRGSLETRCSPRTCSARRRGA